VSETDPIFSAWNKDYADLTNTPTIPTTLAELTGDATHRVVTDSEKNTWNAKQHTVTLTTGGSSGSATFVADTLNIPTYTLAGLGGIGLTSISVTDPLGYDNTTGIFSLAQSSSTTDGYISSTDWNTFNNKQASLGGTTNRISIASNVVDISAAYAGQSSITTLGTITTGVWNGTPITNSNLANSSITIGSTPVALGATTTTLTGLTSVDATTFVGALTGTASGNEVPLTFSTGLTRIGNTVSNNLSTGISGGQSVIGGTGSGENLTLSSTSNATKGKILFGTSAYDEANNRLGIGTTAPNAKIESLSNTEQLRLSYDSTHYLSFSVNNLGQPTIGSNTNGANIFITVGGVSSSYFHPNGIGALTNKVMSWGSSDDTSIGFDGSNLNLNLKPYSYSNATTNFVIKKDTTEYFRIANNGNVGIGATNPTAKLHIKTDAIGVTQNDAYGIVLENTTAATAVLNQNSPAIVLTGYGWKSNATATSQESSWRISSTPITGSSSVEHKLNFEYGSHSANSYANSGTYFYVDRFGQGSVVTQGISTQVITGLTSLSIGKTNPANSTEQLVLNGTASTLPSGSFYTIHNNFGIAPTSGSLAFGSYVFDGTINQTGGANGITRGMYIAPTLTSAADYRAIETTQGSLTMADTYLAGSGSKNGSLLNLSQTWNTTGSPTAMFLNVTNTASGSSSNLLDLQVGGGSLFKVNKLGRVTTSFLDVAFTISGNTYQNGIPFNFSTNFIYMATGTPSAAQIVSGSKFSFLDIINFNPTSGTAEYSSFAIANTINQTGGANGITRGLYIAPTLTAAADFRAIETTQGSLTMADTYLAGSGSKNGSLLNLSQTWNTTGTPTAIKLNVTNTASGGTPLLMDLQVGGSSKFRILSNGDMYPGTIRSSTSSGFISMGSSEIGFYLVTPNSNTGRYNFGVTDATGPTLSRNGTSLDLKLADLSAYSGLNIGSLVASDTTLAGSGSLAGSVLNLSQTWNTTGTPTAIKLNVTNTASGGASLLMDLQTNSTSMMRLTPGGSLTVLGAVNITNGGATALFYQTVNPNASASYFVGGTIAGTVTSGNKSGFTDVATYSPTSGNGTYTSFNIGNTINQTGGANGITRGLYIAPTLTAAADFRAIETTNGSLVMTDSYLAGSGSLAGSLLNLSQTWNTTGTPSAIKLNVTNTASNTNSMLLNLQLGGVTQFAVRTNGQFYFGNPASTTTSIAANGNGIFFRSNNASTAQYGFIFRSGQNSQMSTISGITGLVELAEGFAPTSGTGVYNALTYDGVINQTGGANGITRGLYIAPTLTAAADFRAIELTNNTGKGIYQSGTAVNTLAGFTGIGQTTPGYTLHVGAAALVGIVARFENSTGTCDINPTTSSLACSSDERLKKNITALDGSTLDKLSMLRPVTYNWNAEVDTDATHIGFIAQEVEAVFPNLVSTDPNTGLKSLSYGGLTPYLVKAVQEMNIKITGITDLTTTNTWRDSLIAWFASSANGINEFVSGSVRAKDKLCIGEGVDEVCITKEELLQMKANKTGAPAAATPITPPPVNPVVDPTPTVPTDTSIPTPDPQPVDTTIVPPVDSPSL
jgi:hypothetical protein